MSIFYKGTSTLQDNRLNKTKDSYKGKVPEEWNTNVDFEKVGFFSVLQDKLQLRAKLDLGKNA